MQSENRINAGRDAKISGHNKEQEICEWLNSITDGIFVVDGNPKTKQDVIDITNNIAYSIKSTKGKHTQCHLTSSERWCEYFNIDGKLKSWFMQFFGVPGIDVSDGKSRYHRLKKSEIEPKLNDLALEWFNQNKIEIFDVIVARGMYNTPIQSLIWHQKKTDTKYFYSVDDIKSMVYSGYWIMRPTTLHFITEDNKKLFHLQMKGSGEKYTSSYHSLMFHIHKCF
jgi:hypothetical protein